MIINELINFMSIQQDKGHVTPPVASQTRAALQKVQEVYGTEDSGPSLEELTSMEKVEEIFSRHLTKYPEVLTPASAKKYAQRVVKAAENLLSSKQDPINYKPTFHKVSLGNGERPRSKTKSASARDTAASYSKSSERSSVPEAGQQSPDILTNFPLRSDYVWKAPVPRGLKKAEVRRLAYHLLAYCEDFDPGEPFWRQEGPAPQQSLPNQ